jgi:predicted DNA-binding protein with PD1-like motif
MRLSEDRGSRVYAVVFDPGDEAVNGLTGFAERESIRGASLTAIGGFERAVVGWFDLDRRDYHRIEIGEQVEVLSLVGDLTAGDETSERPKVHVHVVLGRRDGSTLGGHLLEGTVRPTLEVVVSENPVSIRRQHDPATGLALIDPVGAAQEGAASNDQNRS